MVFQLLLSLTLTKMIEELEKNFALVLITEHMPQSLLLMKRMYV